MLAAHPSSKVRKAGVMKIIGNDKTDNDYEVLAPKVAALITLIAVMRLHTQQSGLDVKEGGMKLDSSQLSLCETDPQEWSHTKLQNWINEAEYLLSSMQTCTDSEISELRSLVERELGKKKTLLEI